MTRLEQMLASGELHRIAQGCASWTELAGRLSIRADTLQKARAVIRRAGRPFPTIEELAHPDVRPNARVALFVPDGRRAEEFEEEPTRPVIGKADESDDKWSNANKLLEEWGDPPFPALPKGFAVRELSTNVDANGNIVEQWIGSRREGESFAEIQEAIPNGHRLSGISTLVDETGAVRAQWIKTSANQNKVDPIDVLRAAFGETGVPRAERVPGPLSTDEDILAVIAHGDPHLGQLSWKEDAGVNHDLAIAERHLMSAARHLIDIAPKAARCLLIWIGDNTHSDGQNNTTTKGTRVDVDGRTTKMLGVAIRSFKAEVYMCLEKFGAVHGIIERGNHDELLSAVIAMAVAQHFEDDPRVTIDVSPEMFHYYRFGQNLIGTHHGDKAKPMDLLGVMACDRAKDWGETTHRRWYCGHIHHEVVKEVPGVTVEYLRTLAPSDAWHRGQGYRAGRDLRLDVFHREYGLINRSIVGIQQVIDGMAA